MTATNRKIETLENIAKSKRNRAEHLFEDLMRCEHRLADVLHRAWAEAKEGNPLCQDEFLLGDIETRIRSLRRCHAEHELANNAADDAEIELMDARKAAAAEQVDESWILIFG